MEQTEFHPLMLRAAEQANAGRHQQALQASRELKSRLLSEPKPDAVQLGWARFHEFRALHALKRWREAWDLLQSKERVDYALEIKNLAWMYSVGAEIALELGRAEDVVRCAQRCLQARLEDKDLPSALLCCETAGVLLKKAGRDDLNAPFARFLIERGRAETPNALVAGYTLLLANVARAGDVFVRRELAQARPELWALYAGGKAERIALLGLLGQIESADWFAQLDPVAAAAVKRDVALWQAAADGTTEEVDSAVAAGGRVDGLWAQRPGCPSPLMAAAFTGRRDNAALLLDRGAGLELPNAQGRTALVLAAEQGRVEIVALLLERGARADRADAFGNTALSVAEQRKHDEVARLLRPAQGTA